MDEERLDDIELEAEGDSDPKLTKLKRALEICKKEKDDYLQGWQRAKADYSNAERESRKNQESAIRYAETKLIREILDIVDTFEGAFATPPPDSPWVQGMRNTLEKMRGLLKRYDVEPIETLGKPFDPLWHEAIEVKEVAEEVDDNKVMIEFQKGYRIGEHVIRPAKVSVGEFKKE
ncbi:MAG: nucleotide exchange factor GrpE [Candidatus Ryanbacteria bacterium]|nr:nucleotide exchange factor GrpE [Candidatus Ryanbacteria bacterium]